MNEQDQFATNFKICGTTFWGSAVLVEILGGGGWAGVKSFVGFWIMIEYCNNLYWFNYVQTSCNKGTSVFTSFNLVSIKVKIKAINSMLPNNDNILRCERLSKRGKVPERDYMLCTII